MLPTLLKTEHILLIGSFDAKFVEWNCKLNILAVRIVLVEVLSLSVLASAGASKNPFIRS